MERSTGVETEREVEVAGGGGGLKGRDVFREY